ncbi:MAG: putative membrane protein, partial [uncultured Nocardioides sp.]
EPAEAVPARRPRRGGHLGAAAGWDVPQVRHRDDRARRPGVRHGPRGGVHRLLRRSGRGGRRPALVGGEAPAGPGRRRAAVRHPPLRAVRRPLRPARRAVAAPLGGSCVPGRAGRVVAGAPPRAGPGGGSRRGRRSDRAGAAARPTRL